MGSLGDRDSVDLDIANRSIADWVVERGCIKPCLHSVNCLACLVVIIIFNEIK